MQISVRAAVIAALSIGAAVAAGRASAGTVTIASPTTGNSQLIFWVNDVSNGTTYAQVITGQNVTGSGGLFTYTAGTGNINSVTTYTGDTSFTDNLSNDTALTGFISTAESNSQTLDWGISAGAVGTGAGHNIAIATTPGGDTNVIGIGTSALRSAIGANTTSGLSNDVNLLQSQTADSFNGTTSGVIGTASSESGTNTTYYGIISQGGLSIGPTSSNLYAVTNPSSSVSSSKAVAFNLGTISFNNDILQFNANPGTPPVPLPAAVWLLGSGLLGLAGIGRRRAA